MAYAPSFRGIIRRVFNSTYNALKTTHSQSAIGEGRKVVSVIGTAEALAASTPCRKVLIIAEMNNAGVITVGGAGVVGDLATREGSPLEAGDWIELEIDNLIKVFLDTTVAGDGVTFIYFN